MNIPHIDLIPADCDFLGIVVSRQEVDARDHSGPLGAFQIVRSSNEYVCRFVEAVDLSFSGYDTDPRELWEIPDVRQYVRTLDEAFPYWLFFLSKYQLGLQCVLHCMLTPGLTPEAQQRRWPGELEHLLTSRWFPAMNEMCGVAGLPDDEMFRLTDRVFAYINHGRLRPEP